jgi:polysaccharide biosynthesis/export protein
MRDLRFLTACTGAVLLVLAASITNARAEYRLAPGDVIDFAVAGVPDLHQKTPVDIDGLAAFPLAGSVKASGLTLAELRDALGSLFAKKEFRERGYNSKIQPDVISKDEISVTIGEYRPIYLAGDVSKPGSQTYRPGMTVRQAISLAGGFDLIREKMNNPLLQSSDFQDQYQSAWINFAKEKAHIWRLQAELAGDGTSTADGGDDMPLPKTLVVQIWHIEDSHRQSDLARYETEKNFLTSHVSGLENNAHVLDQQEAAESGGLQSDQEEFDRVQNTFKQGFAPGTRVMEARRAVLLSSTRSLQARLASEQAKVLLETGKRDLAEFQDQQRAGLLRELSEANANLAVLQVRIDTAHQKLAYVAGRTFDLTDVEDQARLVLVRPAQGPVPCALETELLPGDVVQVTLPVMQPAAMAQR